MKINCLTANCFKCKEAKIIRKSPYEGNIYKCNFQNENHGPIEAKTCDNFTCNNNSLVLCKNCSQGKKLVRK